MAPLLSVLMPVRDYSPYLDEAVRSVLEQSVADFELLLIGYSDIENWRHRIPVDDRIRYLQRTDPGIVSALNTGLKSAMGRFIARMDADDISLPQRFQCQLDYLNDNADMDIVGAQVLIFAQQGDLQTGNRHYQQWLNSLTSSIEIANNLYVESPLPHPTWFTRTSTLTHLGGYQNVEWAEDYDLLLRAHLAGMRMGKPESILLHWRDHTDRLTRTDDRYSKAQFIQAKAWALSQSLAKERPVILCGTGRNAIRFHDAMIRYGIDVQCFVELDQAGPRTSRRNRPVITYRELLRAKPDALIVSAVSAYGAREKLRQLFQQQGWNEGRDFVIAG